MLNKTTGCMCSSSVVAINATSVGPEKQVDFWAGIGSKKKKNPSLWNI